MDEQQTTKLLLNTVTGIRKKYDEIARITGENFNIFSVLHLESDEVRLHSRLLGELLNPNGSHNQKDLFLKLFISTLKIGDYNEEDTINAKVLVEENIGDIPDDYSKGGRIDLVIKFANGIKEIVIENKIWAGDQPKQLWRYKKQYPDAHIIYLTPFLNKPTLDRPNIDSLKGVEESELISRESINCRSYHTHIKEWINLCLKEVHHLPLLREVLNHYIILINKLTKQSSSKNMEKDFLDFIRKDDENIKSALFISDNINIIKHHLCNEFKELLVKSFSDQLLPVTIKEGSDKGEVRPFGEEDSFIEIYFKNKCNFKMQLFFASNYHVFHFGILPENETAVVQSQRIQVANALDFLKMKNWADNKAYTNWFWFIRDDYFNLEKCCQKEFISRYNELISKIINALIILN